MPSGHVDDPQQGTSGGGTPRISTDDRAQRVRFRRALTLLLMNLVVPGSAQLVSGSRRLGLIAIRIWLALIVLVVGVGLLAMVSRSFALWAGTNTTLLGVIRLTLIALAAGWAALLVDAWRLGRPLGLHQRQRLTMVAVNGVLCFTVAGALLFSAHVVNVGRESLIALSGNGEVTDANDGRYNVLLIGADAGAGRWGLRADSLNVASIDAETGKTVLISLPRNMQNFPFAQGSVMDKQFPDGFDEPDIYLNGLTTWAADHKELFKGVDEPGIEATMQAVEGITDLKINYWAMVNLEGFKDLVDAVGGVELNVRQPIPVGLPHEKSFHYIETGTRTLNGHDTLWYARAREGSDDYSRMARQKCVMSAMLEQISPSTMVTNFSQIAQAGTELVSTDLPGSEMDNFINLALKAKDQKIGTLSLVPPMINTANPDIELVHAKVAEAIAKAEGVKVTQSATAEPAGQASADAKDNESSAGSVAPVADSTPTQQATPVAPSDVTGGSVGSLSDGYAANESGDLGAVC